jgi:hypothetical protein
VGRRQKHITAKTREIHSNADRIHVVLEAGGRLDAEITKFWTFWFTDLTRANAGSMFNGFLFITNPTSNRVGRSETSFVNIFIKSVTIGYEGVRSCPESHRFMDKLRMNHNFLITFPWLENVMKIFMNDLRGF